MDLPQDLFMGVDLSTQGVKIIFLDENMKTITSESVHFQHQHQQQQQEEGGITRGEEGEVGVEVEVWLEGVERGLKKVKERWGGGLLERVRGLGCSAQQHGSVYWREGGENSLKNLSPLSPLTSLSPSFSPSLSPIWMDSSTKEECKFMEEWVGGREKLAEITGSRAYERFTGSQIRKVIWNKTEKYEKVERISLVSSFISSLFVGFIAPIDIVDGSGMNLLDIKTKTWSDTMLNCLITPPHEKKGNFAPFSAKKLKEQLGPVVEPGTQIGHISEYMQKRFGFSSDCVVVCGSGDNPCSLVGLCVEGHGEAAISLGTSDTLFLLNHTPPSPPPPSISLFCSVFCPQNKGEEERGEGEKGGKAGGEGTFLCLLCYKNGSKSREYFKRKWLNHEDRDWVKFNEALQNTTIGNGGKVGLFFKEKEIIPDCASGEYRVDENDNFVEHFDSPEEEIRAMIESRFLSMFLHSRSLGVNSFSSLQATGGGAANPYILQIMSDIFGAEVYSSPGTINSAAVGGAIQAAYCYLKKRNITIGELFKKRKSEIQNMSTFLPNKKNHQLYLQLLERYEKLEERVLEGKGKREGK